MKKYAIIRSMVLAFSLSILICNVSFAEQAKGIAFPDLSRPLKGQEAELFDKACLDAKRNFVESKIGTKIDSETEMVNYVVVRDHVVAQSTGYVTQKAVISCGFKGNTYEVYLDLEARETIAEVLDPKQFLQNMSRNASRSGIDVAFIDDDNKGRERWSDAVSQSLNMQGFKCTHNREVIKFMSENTSMNLDDFALDAEIRERGIKGRRGSHAIAHGHIRTRVKPILIDGNYYAVAEIYGKVVGYESDVIDPVSVRAEGYGRTPADAEDNAKQAVCNQASNVLAKMATETIQREERGGVRELDTMFIFKGGVNGAQESDWIIDALEKSNCEVIRSGFDGPDFMVYVESTAFGKMGDLVRRVMGSLRAQYPSATNSDNGNEQIITLR